MTTGRAGAKERRQEKGLMRGRPHGSGVTGATGAAGEGKQVSMKKYELSVQLHSEMNVRHTQHEDVCAKVGSIPQMMGAKSE